MKFSPTRIINLIVIIIVVFLNYSCSKDSDLLADYVVGENAGKPGNLVDLQNGTIITFEDKMVAINILKNSQSSSKPKSTVVKKVDQPKNGKTEIKTDSTIVYTPNKDFTGKDDVVYTVEETAPDNTTVKKENTIVVAVNPVLEVKDDKVATTADKKVVIPVLKNDTYADKNKATVTKTTTPAKGTVVVNNDNTLTYTPNADASGSDTFTYTVQVENAEKTASTADDGTVTVNIIGNNNISMGNELLAFPGAVGHGRYTTGGRGGSVYQVTNLNDSGPGSFRDAVSKGNRTIVFRVGGVIEISSTIRFGGDNITIAGQTAPGEGIAIHGGMVDTNGHENIIVRYVNFMVGDKGVRNDSDSFRILHTGTGVKQNFILDHCGFFWGMDETLSIEANDSEVGSIEKVTVQNSIIGESLNAKGMIIWRQGFDISFINNLFSNNHERNIRSSTRYASWEQINNVIYNYYIGVNPTWSNEFDIIGNVFMKKGSTISDVNYEKGGNTPSGVQSDTKAFISDNTYNGNPIKTNISGSILKASRVVSSGYSPIANIGSAVLEQVLNNVGANLNGNNVVAQKQINDVKNNTGAWITSESQTVALSLKGGTPYNDTDNDGMEDSWELANNLNPNDKSDASKDRNGDGYTNLEEFLYYLTIK